MKKLIYFLKKKNRLLEFGLWLFAENYEFIHVYAKWPIPYDVCKFHF